MREELEQPEDPSPEKELKTVEKINSALLGKEVDPKVKQKLRYAKENWLGKLAEYEQKEQRSHYPLLWCYFDVALVLLWYGFAVREMGVWIKLGLILKNLC